MVYISVLYKYFWLAAFQAYGGAALPISHSRLRLPKQNFIDSWLKQQTFVSSQYRGVDVRSGASRAMSGETLAWPHLLPSPQVLRVSSEGTRRYISLLPLPCPSPSLPFSSPLSLPLLRSPRILLKTPFSLHYPLEALVPNTCMGAGVASSMTQAGRVGTVQFRDIPVQV